MKNETPMTPEQGNFLTMILFSITALIYFATAGYIHFYTLNPEMSDISTNIALGVMFFCIGLSFLTTKKK
jgi:hypothetical protein